MKVSCMKILQKIGILYRAVNFANYEKENILREAFLNEHKENSHFDPAYCVSIMVYYILAFW